MNQRIFPPVSVMVVIQDHLVRTVCTRLLKLKGYEVTQTQDTQFIIEMCTSNPYTIVILDSYLLKSDSMALLRRLMDLQKNVGVIAIVLPDELDLIIQALRLGAFDCLTKPVELHCLEQTLDNCSFQIQYGAARFHSLPISSYRILVAEDDPLLLSSCRILIAEDDPLVRTVEARLLKMQGHQVDQVDNGLRALEIFMERRYDLVITDLSMPLLNGLGLLRQLKEVDPDVQVIFVTAFGSADAARAAFKLGAFDFLTKPLELDDLEKAIVSCIRYIQFRRQQLALGPSIDMLINAINDAAKNDSMSLVTASIQNCFHYADMYTSGAIHIPFGKHVIQVGIADLAALVPTSKIDFSINQMIDHFYAHPLMMREPHAMLTFGWAHGPCFSADELIESAASDLIERSQSQGIKLQLKPAILNIQGERLDLEHQYKATRFKGNMHLKNLISKSRGKDSIFSRVEKLTAIMNHDLNTGMREIHQTTEEIARQRAAISPETQKIVSDVQNQIILVTACQSSLNELGTGPLIKKQLINDFGAWVKLHLTILHTQLKLPFELLLDDIPQTLTLRLDTRPLLAACLTVLVSAATAGASRLRVKVGTNETGTLFTIIFEDDGEAPPRITSLETSILKWPGEHVPWSFQRLTLLAGILQQQNIRLSYQQLDKAFQMHWIFPDLIQSVHNTFVPLNLLRDEVRRLNQDRMILESSSSTSLRSQSSEPLPEHYLLPYTQELEQSLNDLNRLSTVLSCCADINQHSVQRVFRLSLYCYLLVHNLTHALRGVELRVELVDINDEINQVLELLEHKIAPIHVSLNLTPHLPKVSLASIETKQVFLNIIKNAAEVMRQRDSLYITTFCKKGRVIIQIQDTGVGIPRQYRERIFELQFSTKARGESSGIGLYTVKSIITRVGGHVRVASAMRTSDGRLMSWKRGFRRNIDWTRPGTLFEIDLPGVKRQ